MMIFEERRAQSYRFWRAWDTEHHTVLFKLLEGIIARLYPELNAPLAAILTHEYGYTVFKFEDGTRTNIMLLGVVLEERAGVNAVRIHVF